MVPKAVVK
jgi:hypothetical protein